MSLECLCVLKVQPPLGGEVYPLYRGAPRSHRNMVLESHVVAMTRKWLLSCCSQSSVGMTVLGMVSGHFASRQQMTLECPGNGAGVVMEQGSVPIVREKT